MVLKKGIWIYHILCSINSKNRLAKNRFVVKIKKHNPIDNRSVRRELLDLLENEYEITNGDRTSYQF